MRTTTTDDVLPLTKKQKYASNIVMGVLLVAAGVILILAGTGVIDASVRLIAAPTILFAFGVSVLVSAIIAKNSLSMWLAGVILTCGLTSLLAAATDAGYGELYPLYIASPGIGCLFAVWFAEAIAPQVKVMVFFGALAGIFGLQASGACGWGLTGGLLAAFAGACVIAYAVLNYITRNDDNA